MRYISRDGSEKKIEGVTSYIGAIESGDLSAESLVYAEDSGRWVHASETSEFQSLKAGRLIADAKVQARQARKKRLTALGICVLAIVMLFLTPQAWDGGHVAGYKFGQGFFFFSVAAVIAYLAFRKEAAAWKARAELWVAIGFLALCAWAVYSDWESAEDNKRARAAALAASDQIARIDLEAKAALEGKPTQPAPTAEASVPSPQASSQTKPTQEPPPSMKTSPSASRGESFERVMNRLVEFRRDVVNLQTGYLANLNKLNLEQVLTPQRLATHEGRAASRVTLKDAESATRAFVSKYEARLAKFFADARTEVSNEEEWQEFKKGFDKGFARNRSLTDEWIKVQNDFLAESRALVDLVDRPRGRVQLDGDSLRFSEQSDMDAFNQRVERIQNLAVREEQLLQETQKLQADGLDKMRKLGSGNR